MTTHSTACILCSRNCGLTVEVEGENFTSIRGDAAHPVSKGYQCQKSARLAYYQQNADRLEHPLKRQPDGSFTRVSWDEALTDIAARLVAIREKHGGDAFAFVGGGGQGNHLGGAYNRELLAAMKSRYAYNSLGQEKTGDFWLNGRIFGRQTCHTTEDVEHADFLLVIGANPFQSHGIPNARETLNAIKKDPLRTLVVVDPRRTETAKAADVHLQIRPGTDAFLMSAMLAIIVREGLHDGAFLARHCTGFAAVEAALREIPIEAYVARTGLALADVERVARGYARAERGCLRIDLGLQHSLHVTLNGYLEKLLFLVTGHFGKKGGNNLHTFLLPVLGHTDERVVRKGKQLKRTAHHKMFPIAGIYPPNILADEIEHPGEDRLRAVFVDSSNPILNYTDTGALARAFAKLELLVVVDVVMTETAALAHYVLPAASQFEKVEATGFNLEFPENAFHLRRPIFAPHGESLPEPEIYTRLLEKMGALPARFPVLERIAKHEPAATGHLAFLAAMGALLAREPQWAPLAASIVYRTLGQTLPAGMAAAAPLLALTTLFANQHYAAVRRAGHRGNRLTLGNALFEAILNSPSGVVMSKHEYADTWSLVANADRKAHLAVPEMFAELRALKDEKPAEAPFILMLGERRAYNANQIFRDPAWRKVDPHGALRLHPADAARLQLASGDKAVCKTQRAEIEVVVSVDDTVLPGVAVLPHGYGQVYAGQAVGPAVNVLTWSAHCDPLTKTPYHKYVPAYIRPK
jgi:anaerobic selenocysteine-containing dehydrogenase